MDGHLPFTSEQCFFPFNLLNGSQNLVLLIGKSIDLSSVEKCREEVEKVAKLFRDENTSYPYSLNVKDQKVQKITSMGFTDEKAIETPERFEWD